MFVSVENCELLFFLQFKTSALISQYQRLHIRALCNFFGQEDHRPPPPPQVRMCPYAYGHICPKTAVSEVKQNTVPMEGQRTLTNINLLLLFVKTAWNFQL